MDSKNALREMFSGITGCVMCAPSIILPGDIGPVERLTRHAAGAEKVYTATRFGCFMWSKGIDPMNLKGRIRDELYPLLENAPHGEFTGSYCWSNCWKPDEVIGVALDTLRGAGKL